MITDTDRLDFICSTLVKAPRYLGDKEGDGFGLQMWNGKEYKDVKGNTHRECIDKAIAEANSIIRKINKANKKTNG